jgi:hypothetical protein
MAPQTLNTTRDVHNPVTQDARGGGHIANVPVHVNVNLGKETLVVVVMLALVIGACGVVIGMDVAERAAQQRQSEENTARLQREWMRDTKAMNDHADDLARKYRMAELKYDELNLTVRRAGIGRTDDDQTGVGGNLDPEAFGQPFLHKRKGK